MASVVFAVPYFPPPPPPPAFPGLGMTWRGWDDSVWDLTGRDSSGVALQPGVRGLTMPPTQRRSTVSPAVPGSRTRGHQVLDRDVFWPVRIWNDDSSQGWIEHDRAFWATLTPERVGLWVVTQPDGTERSLACRYVDEEAGLDIDPSLIGWALYGVHLVAEEPFWRGRAVVREWEAHAPASFVPEGGGPPFTISEGSTIAAATMANPGDVDAWPTWWVVGPEPTATLGVGDRVIDIPFAVAAGRLLVVDPSPTAMTALEIDASPLVGGKLMSDADQVEWVDAHLATATDRTRELGAATKFGSIPAGSSIELTLTAPGTGRVRASLVPQYWRAW